LLAKALLAFALEFEGESEISLDRGECAPIRRRTGARARSAANERSFEGSDSNAPELSGKARIRGHCH
jgi:hypothetical protein